MKKQAHIYYTGRVQGVGFRFTAEDIANSLGIAGWVKNLSDGRVEVLAQAEEETLKEFLVKISEYFSDYIKDTEISWLPVSDEFKDFGVKF
ncbi:MAG: acylphosphatase [Candidatus Omnitrophota bacterium]